MRPANTMIIANSGSTVSTTILLKGTDGNPIDLLGLDPIDVSLIDVSPALGAPTIVVGIVGDILVTIPWDSDRVNGQVYRFRVRYFFEGDDIVQTTPLFELVYQ
jgi:hypothetical protein